MEGSCKKKNLKAATPIYHLTRKISKKTLYTASARSLNSSIACLFPHISIALFSGHWYSWPIIKNAFYSASLLAALCYSVASLLFHANHSSSLPLLALVKPLSPYHGADARYHYLSLAANSCAHARLCALLTLFSPLTWAHHPHYNWLLFVSISASSFLRACYPPPPPGLPCPSLPHFHTLSFTTHSHTRRPLLLPLPLGSREGPILLPNLETLDTQDRHRPLPVPPTHLWTLPPSTCITLVHSLWCAPTLQCPSHHSSSHSA